MNWLWICDDAADEQGEVADRDRALAARRSTDSVANAISKDDPSVAASPHALRRRSRLTNCARNFR